MPRNSPDITLLTESDLRDVVTLNMQSLACIEDGFRVLATGKIAMPPILRLDIPEYNGEVDVKTAYVPGVDSFAIKISPGFFDNPKLGLPSVNGLMILLSARTGMVESLLLDNGYLTDIRTAAAGGIAAKWLARKNATKAGIVGAGAQAALQLQALCLVRDIQQAVIWARDTQKSESFARKMQDSLGIPVTPCDSPRAVAAASDIVVTTTPSNSPLLFADDVPAGLHITAMGSDAEHKNELDPQILASADLYVCDRRNQCSVLGELHHARAVGILRDDTLVTELGEIVAGQKPGRQSDSDRTVADLTGTGMQDTAIATLARQLARKAGCGRDLNV